MREAPIVLEEGAEVCPACGSDHIVRTTRVVRAFWALLAAGVLFAPFTAGFSLVFPGAALLLDCGTGAITRLEAHLDPRALTAVIVGHLHGDHFLDLVPLRYLFPWAGGVERRLPVLIPPGQRERIDALALAISERSGFFDDVFEVVEYDPSATLRIADLEVSFRRTGPKARLALFWSGPQFRLEPIPARALSHAREDSVADDFERGSLLSRVLRCENCHGEATRSPGPALDRLAGHIARDWLVGHLAPGKRADSATSPRRMPEVGLSAEQAELVAEWLLAAPSRTQAT